MTDVKNIAVCGPARTGSTLVWQIATKISGKVAKRSHEYFYSPEFIILVPYRDPRDSVCSFANICGGCNEENIIHSINVLLKNQNAGGLLRKYIDNAREDGNVFLIRYEEFFNNQKELALFISEKIEIPIDNDEVNRIIDKFSLQRNKERSEKFENFGQWCETTMIHGEHITNNGRIGTWKKFFNKEIKLIVHELIGNLLIELNYEKDDSWIQ